MKTASTVRDVKWKLASFKGSQKLWHLWLQSLCHFDAILSNFISKFGVNLANVIRVCNSASFFTPILPLRFLPAEGLFEVGGGWPRESTHTTALTCSSGNTSSSAGIQLDHDWIRLFVLHIDYCCLLRFDVWQTRRCQHGVRSILPRTVRIFLILKVLSYK